MTLEEVRKEIDSVDSEIKKLFEKRMLLADAVARVKAETEDEIYKPDREKAIIDRLSAGVDDSIVMEYKALIKRIMEISRKYQYGRTLELRPDALVIDTADAFEPVSVGMLKSEVYMKPDRSVKAYDSYDKLADAIDGGVCDAGTAVLENIGVGISDGLHDCLLDRHFYINRCEIIDDDGVRRKLATFSRKLVIEPEHNRLKIAFVCKNHSGSLSSVLSMISDYGVNLTEIHSSPFEAEEWNYVFYIEMTANLTVREDRALIYQLMNETDMLAILGSYVCG